MIDFHSHILPGIDDGAKDPEQSMDMLRACAAAGVKKVVLTPHCYHTDDKDIRDYIRQRNEKYRTLKKTAKDSGENLPEILLGCELHLSKFHAKSEYLRELAIEGTNYIMLEMPMGKWENELYDAIYSISLKGLRPIMAHIDRYFFGHKKDFHNLYSLDLAYQANCDSFLMPRIKKQMPYFFEAGAIHLLGSDMHNLSSRTTHMAECKKTIIEKYGQKYYDFLDRNSNLVLQNKDVDIQYFDKMTFWQKIKL